MNTTVIVLLSLLASIVLGFTLRTLMMRRRIPWWKKLFSSRAGSGGAATIATAIEAALGEPGSAKRSLIYATACLTAVYTLVSLRSRLRQSLTAQAEGGSKATAVYQLKQNASRNGSMTLAEDAG